MSAQQYRKHFIPLESNPEVFNNLIGLLGAPPSLSFQDVWSLDDLESIPRPVLALILIFPTDNDYEKRRETYSRDSKDDKDVIWFKQTINNACGLYAILHAVANSAARDMLDASSTIASLINVSANASSEERATVLEQSEELEAAYTVVAAQGTSSVPENAEEEVDFHFVCFVKANVNNRLYELDGDLPGPVDRRIVLGTDADVLAAESLDLIRSYLEQGGGNATFNLMALVNVTAE